MFGIDVIDAGLLPALFVALAAGILSFLSPCVLPIVPSYLAYMGGVSVSEMQSPAARRRGLVLTALSFVMGLSTVFLILGFAFSAAGRMLLAWQGWFTPLAGATIMVMGAHFLGVIRIGILDREARVDPGDHGGTTLGAYVLGLAFAFGWTPCLGPILGAILGIAATEADMARGALLLAAYAAGLGVPFVLFAAFFPSLGGLMAWLRRNMGRVQRISGLLLWTVGLMMLTGQFSDFAFWLLETFPALGMIG